MASWRITDLPRESTLEDYARNILATAVADPRSDVLIVDGDSAYSAVLYVQALGTAPDVVTVEAGRVYDDKMVAQLRRKWPEFHLDDRVVHGRNPNIIEAVIEPNVDLIGVTHDLRRSTTRLRTTFYPVGRKLARGTGIDFAEPGTPPVYRQPVYELDPAYAENHSIFSAYADYYLARGRDALLRGASSDAHRYFHEGAAVVPWCTPCRERACAIISDESCESHE